MATPLIRIPQAQGGTMYAFASASNDLTRAYYNPDINFEYSKFALIDIPVVDTPAGGATNNFIQFENLVSGGGSTAPVYDITSTTDDNVHFAKTFQNYALNLENFILTDDDFDVSLYESDAEKIFFKYLNEIGAFRTKAAISDEAVEVAGRLVEHDNSTLTGAQYSKVVKYIGNIDVSNDKQYGGEVYNEIFVNVPSSVGYTPTILFKESNYNTTATSYTPATEYINGRASQTHPDPNLDMEVIGEGTGSTPAIYNINASTINSSQHCGIEWEDSQYANIASDPLLNNLFEYSKRGGDFRFNAVLVYYDVYSKSEPANRATNLYGVILLDNFKDGGGSGMYIPELTKNKPNDITGLNGNSYALKLNVKFNSSLDNVGVESNINDYSTFSMDLFFDTTSTLESAAGLLRSANDRYSKIAERLDDLEGMLLTSPELVDLSARMKTIEADVENASLNYADSTSLLDLVTSANNRINLLISGEIESSVQVNTDVIKSTVNGGIEITRSADENFIKLKAINDGYTLAGSFQYDIANNSVSTEITSSSPFTLANSANFGIYHNVRAFNNLVRIYSDVGTATENLNIYLDDTNIGWSEGQVLRITFRNDWKLGAGKTISIFTDKSNGWVEKITITAADRLSLMDYIEIICVDAVTKTFEYDIIR
jgi:hypothetical protein